MPADLITIRETSGTCGGEGVVQTKGRHVTIFCKKKVQGCLGFDWYLEPRLRI